MTTRSRGRRRSRSSRIQACSTAAIAGSTALTSAMRARPAPASSASSPASNDWVCRRSRCRRRLMSMHAQPAAVISHAFGLRTSRSDRRRKRVTVSWYASSASPGLCVREAQKRRTAPHSQAEWPHHRRGTSAGWHSITGHTGRPLRSVGRWKPGYSRKSWWWSAPVSEKGSVGIILAVSCRK